MAKKEDHSAHKKRFWRCKVCGDIHYGVGWPNPCPTCGTPKSYAEVSEDDVKGFLCQ